LLRLQICWKTRLRFFGTLSALPCSESHRQPSPINPDHVCSSYVEPVYLLTLIDGLLPVSVAFFF
jgi:hypothetical protein